MKVQAHGPHSWFLLVQDDGGYLLDARVSTSLTDYALTIALTAAERQEYQALGRVYLDYLAARIQHWPQQYQARQVSRQLAAAASAAIAGWQAAAR